MCRLPSWLEPRTAYIHVPFCAHHCGYCDFAVSVGSNFQIPLYIEALELELRTLGTPRYVDSIFIGGGTPTYLPIEHLRRLLSLIQQWFPWHPDAVKREYSIESTPDSLDPERCALLAEFGVNRVSIGVQSFQASTLGALDRKHRVDQIESSIKAVTSVIPSYSLDLIFAAPGATLAGWQDDLTRAIAYKPGHISTYGLTYESQTPLGKMKEQGKVVAMPEDEELKMYQTSIEMLTGAGYEHYEISNFAQPGQRCEHNERYWANEAYYGVGVGAARYVNGTRDINIRNTNQYIRNMLAGEPIVMQSETLDPRERAMETMAVQLRRCEGIELQSFQAQTGYELLSLVGVRLVNLVGHGLLEQTPTHVRLTLRGRCVADGIIEDLMTSQSC